jgi:hypothetical protein
MLLAICFSALYVCMYVCNCMKYTLNIVTAIICIHTFIRLDMWNLRE